ncbi:hypothetical protein LLEC1_02332 [Akanthomyces lecanii]|uniref:4-nitrophenylphosphatase n=1 Tax=Cordyceps confragosa TaxID=2714763 RepID=A0A179IC33_CORDF|nr:hypothetical protein LLEC1_02332 [Akanthomyces lecanii]
MPNGQLTRREAAAILDRYDRTSASSTSLSDSQLKAGKKLIFVTNNSTASRDSVYQRLKEFGIAASIEEIFTSGYSTAVYLTRFNKLSPPRDKVFILGSTGIEEELAAVGIEFAGGTDQAFQRQVVEDDFRRLAEESNALSIFGAVVVGMDLNVNYLKLSHAVTHVRNGAAFLATNLDATFPTSGASFPASGSLAAAVSKAAGVEPLLMGKPSPWMMDAILARYGPFDRHRTCMVGDGLDVDIRFGSEQGLGTLLVLSGVSSLEDLENTRYEPEAVVGRLADLVPELQHLDMTED